MSSTTHSSKKDIGWKYCYQKEGEKSLRCKFSHHQSNGGVTRLKQHLAQTHKGVAPCASVPDDVKKEIRDSLEKTKINKLKQTQLLREIGEGLGSTKNSANDESEDVVTHLSTSKQKGTLDGLVTSEPKQATLNSAYKKELLVDLRERSIVRRNKIDPIVVDEIDSDDEWITEKEDPVLPESTKWLEDDELFEGDPIVSVPAGLFDSLLDSERRIEYEVPPTVSKKRVGESSSGVKDKGKQPRVRLVDEDVALNDIDGHGGLGLNNFDSGNFPTIDSLDDDSNIILDDEDCDYF
ncbi:hypothetical protein OROMI_023548 [Orobanche minor]